MPANFTAKCEFTTNMRGLLISTFIGRWSAKKVVSKLQNYNDGDNNLRSKIASHDPIDDASIQSKIVGAEGDSNGSSHSYQPHIAFPKLLQLKPDRLGFELILH